jgi:Ca-activated chloride channel homolog
MSRLGRRTATAIAILMLAAACSAAPTDGGRTPAPPDHQRWPPPPTPRVEPGQTPYRDVNFQDVGVNPFTDPLRDPFATFAMDVDTASYGIARRFIEDGNLPPRDAIRLEEFVNAFDYNYPSPDDDAFAIHVDGGPSPYTGSNAILVRVGIQARRIADADRSPASLTFIIDTSGSMAMENRLELVKDALGVLVGGLHADDSVAIVEFGSDARVVLNPTSAAEPQVILDAIGRLTAGGSTNAQAGLELGYDLAVLGRRARCHRSRRPRL